jgi:hypothetical protein
MVQDYIAATRRLLKGTPSRQQELQVAIRQSLRAIEQSRRLLEEPRLFPDQGEKPDRE